MSSYIVKYRVGMTNAQTSINLRYGSESEAIEALKARGTVGRDKSIIILSITPN